MEVISFGRDNIDNILQQEPNRVEHLPFGAVMLDREGRVVKYNAAEAMISGRSADQVMGKGFFTEVAPCSRGKRFHAEFMNFYRTGKVHALFDYEFDYKMERAKVRIHMKATDDGQHCWLFIKRF